MLCPSIPDRGYRVSTLVSCAKVQAMGWEHTWVNRKAGSVIDAVRPSVQARGI